MFGHEEIMTGNRRKFQARCLTNCKIYKHNKDKFVSWISSRNSKKEFEMMQTQLKNAIVWR